MTPVAPSAGHTRPDLPPAWGRCCHDPGRVGMSIFCDSCGTRIQPVLSSASTRTARPTWFGPGSMPRHRLDRQHRPGHPAWKARWPRPWSSRAHFLLPGANRPPGPDAIPEGPPPDAVTLTAAPTKPGRTLDQATKKAAVEPPLPQTARGPLRYEFHSGDEGAGRRKTRRRNTSQPA